MIIQKFGGIAMKDQQARAACIAHIKKALALHGSVIVVVSAIGRLKDPYSTDRLLQITDAFYFSATASDLVASCGELIASAVLSAELERDGVDNIVLHGSQAGIITRGTFGNAVIDHINPTIIKERIQEKKCILIPGFQGINVKGEFMTLGRGGSDLTAIAVGAAMQAKHVEFFKDVPGVMTKDPKFNKDAQKIDTLSIDKFLNMLNSERSIIQRKAALYAKKTAMPLYIRGITGTENGTWIYP